MEDDTCSTNGGSNLQNILLGSAERNFMHKEFNRSKETAGFNRPMVGWRRFLLWTWQNADTRDFPTTWVKVKIALLVNSAPQHKTSLLAGALYTHRMTPCLQWCTLYWHINYDASR